MTGTDLTRIDGIDVQTATTVISETGYDMSKWQTENQNAGCIVTQSCAATTAYPDS